MKFSYEKSCPVIHDFTLQDTILFSDTRTEKAIRDADIIVVMDQGKIVESGGHDSLLARKGKYYELYMTQYAGFAT